MDKVDEILKLTEGKYPSLTLKDRARALDILTNDRPSYDHHYIPQYLLKGFSTSDKKQFYVYDKLKGEILQRPKSIKSYFFESGRNNIELPGGTISSYIEKIIYEKVDNWAGRLINNLRNLDKAELENISIQMQNEFLFFILTLFWRIPFTDTVADMMHNIIDQPDNQKHDEGFKKVCRFLFIKSMYEQINAKGLIKSGASIYCLDEDCFVIGDNPIFFKLIPDEFADFGDAEFLCAIGSDRIYHRHGKRFGFSKKNAIDYNIQVIHQSKYYVASSNLELLQECKNLYESKPPVFWNYATQYAFIEIK